MAKLRASMSVEEFDDGYFSRGQEKGPDCRRCRGRRPAAGPDSAAPGAGRVGEQPPGLHRRRRRARQSGAHGWLVGLRARAGARLPAPDYVPLRASRAGEPTAAARSSRHVPAQAVAVGHPSGRRQPPHISTTTSTSSPSGSTAGAHGTAGCCSTAWPSRLCRSPLCRTRPWSKTSGEALGETTRCRGHLSQLDNQHPWFQETEQVSTMILCSTPM